MEVLLRVALVLVAVIGGPLWILFALHSLGLRRSRRLTEFDERHSWVGRATGLSASNAEGVVGPKIDVVPALVDLRKRKYIAGVLRNTRDNLVRWIVDPHAVVPDSLMPDLNVSMTDTEAMADYLLGTQQ